MRSLAFLVLLLICPSIYSQTIKVPAEVKGEKYDLIQVVIDYDGDVFEYEICGQATAMREYDATPNRVSLRVLSKSDGEITIFCFTCKDKKSAKAKTKIIVGAPVPPGPNPPGPNPPGPTPTVPIIGVDGNAVLLCWELDASGVKANAEQKAFLYSPETESYLDSKCASDPARSDWKAWRRLPKASDMSADVKAWQDAMARPKNGNSPWIIISTKTKGSYEGSLPATKAECMALLKKYLD